MRDDDVAFEDIQFLTGSPQRRSVLGALCDAPARPHELCADIDATRTTIQRILAGFRERRWAVKHDGDYRATVTGRRVYERYEALLGEARRAREFGPLAAHLGPVGDELPVDAVETGALTVSEDGSPLAPLQQFTEWFRAAEGEICAMTPVVAQPFNEIGVELVESGVGIVMIIDETVLEQSRTHHETEWTFAVGHDRVDIYVHESPLPVGLAYDDEGCCLVVYDDDSNMRGVLESTTAELSEWASATFERYRERAVPLPKHEEAAAAMEAGTDGG